MAAGLDEERTPGFARLYAEAKREAEYARFWALCHQRKESTMNLKQNELLALIARYARDLLELADRPALDIHRAHMETGLKTSVQIRERVERIQQIAAELE